MANINLPALLISKALLFPHSKITCKIKYSDQQSSKPFSIFLASEMEYSISTKQEFSRFLALEGWES